MTECWKCGAPATIPTDLPFGKLIQALRGRDGLRKAATQAGVSAASISRVENGHMPDLIVFRSLCKWARLDMAHELERIER